MLNAKHYLRSTLHVVCPEQFAPQQSYSQNIIAHETRPTEIILNNKFNEHLTYWESFMAYAVWHVSDWTERWTSRQIVKCFVQKLGLTFAKTTYLWCEWQQSNFHQSFVVVVVDQFIDETFTCLSKNRMTFPPDEIQPLDEADKRSHNEKLLYSSCCLKRRPTMTIDRNEHQLRWCSAPTVVPIRKCFTIADENMQTRMLSSGEFWQCDVSQAHFKPKCNSRTHHVRASI